MHGFGSTDPEKQTTEKNHKGKGGRVVSDVRNTNDDDRRLGWDNEHASHLSLAANET